MQDGLPFVNFSMCDIRVRFASSKLQFLKRMKRVYDLFLHVVPKSWRNLSILTSCKNLAVVESFKVFRSSFLHVAFVINLYQNVFVFTLRSGSHTRYGLWCLLAWHNTRTRKKPKLGKAFSHSNNGSKFGKHTSLCMQKSLRPAKLLSPHSSSCTCLQCQYAILFVKENRKAHSNAHRCVCRLLQYYYRCLLTCMIE